MKQIIEKKVFFFGNFETLLLATVAFAIPFQINYGNIPIIVSIFYAFLLLIYKGASLNNFKSFGFLIPVILFLTSIFSALTSKDIGEGIHQLEKLLLMVLIPFVIYAFRERNLCFFKIFISFSSGVIIATSILLLVNLLKIISGDSLDKLFFYNFTELYSQHPVYFSTNILLSFFFLFHFFLIKRIKCLSSVVVYLLLIIHLLGLIFCASKAVIFCFFVLLTLYLIIFMKVISKKILLIISGIFFISLSSIILNPYLNERFIDGLDYDFTNFEPTDNLLESKKFTLDEKENISDLELRLIFLKIGLFHTVHDEKVLFGYGLGDAQHYLDYYYMTYNLAPNWYEGRNLHNQYLQYFVTYGIFGFSFLILYLLFNLHFSLRRRNILHLLFILMIMFVYIFEVYLVRNKGIVFFFFFNSIFLIYNQHNENRNIRN